MITRESYMKVVVRITRTTAFKGTCKVCYKKTTNPITITPITSTITAHHTEGTIGRDVYYEEPRHGVLEPILHRYSWVSAFIAITGKPLSSITAMLVIHCIILISYGSYVKSCF